MRKFKIVYINPEYDLRFITIKEKDELTALDMAKKEIKNQYLDIKIYEELKLKTNDNI